jgi:photosystem II stability/assembly factor-like uncharacterized protein
LSVGALADEGKAIIFTKSHCMVWDNLIDRNVLATGAREKSNGLYKLTSQGEAYLTETVDEVKLWHRRYGHLHYRGLVHLAKEG